MRSCLPALKDFLASRQPFYSADLFTISLLNGSTLRLTSADRNISYGGNTWLGVPGNPVIQRSTWKMTNTPEVPDMAIVISSTGSDYSGGNIKQQAHNGLLDGATIQLDRVFMPTPGDTSLGTVLLFSGRTSTVEIDGLQIKLTVKALSIILQQFMPRNMYKAGCSWALYGTGCGLNRATWTATNTVGSGSSLSQIVTTGDWILPSAATVPIASLLLGTLTIASGSASGQRRTIVGGTTGAGGGVIKFGYPLYSVPSPGDSLTAVLGCDKTQATCLSRFNNLQNYRGFDYIPIAETAF